MSIWLQSVTTHEKPLDPDWIRNHDVLLASVWTTKHPDQWEVGDTVVYYASGHCSIVAIVLLDGEADGGGGCRCSGKHRCDPSRCWMSRLRLSLQMPVWPPFRSKSDFPGSNTSASAI